MAKTFGRSLHISSGLMLMVAPILGAAWALPHATAVSSLARLKSTMGYVTLPSHSFQLRGAKPAAVSRRFPLRSSRTLLTMSEDTKDATKPFVCTTPLYYVNGPPHMGSAYPTMAADVLAQYQRMRGREAVFVTGSDEHGEKIATTAASNNKENQEFVDGMVGEFKDLWEKLGIRYDSFVRTTDPKHEAVVRDFFQRVSDNGDIYKKDYSGRYCVGCEAYLGDDEMETIDGVEHCCKIHRKPCEERTEENYFFRLSKYQGALEKLFEDRPDFVQPAWRFNEVKGFVDKGVPDFSISRSTISWGIPVPNDPDQVIYVWFDALLGYISALLHDDDEPSLENALKRGWPCDVHIIGKDILRFHAVYWPAMLMSAGVPLPKYIYSHGFLTKDGLKMGKSLGNVLEPSELVDKHGADAVRYYFTKGLDFGGDGDFAAERFALVLNADLANDVGNLLQRAIKPLTKHVGTTFPAHTTPEDNPLRAMAADAAARCGECYEKMDFRGAGEAALELARFGNKFIDDQAPWAMFKQGKVEEGVGVLMACLESTRLVAVLLSPMVPTVAGKIYAQLGFTPDEFAALTWADAEWRDLPEGREFPQPAGGVFERIDLGLKEEDKKIKPAPKQKKTQQQAPAVEDILRVDMRVGKIVQAAKHPDADSLYVEQIDLGEGKPRTVVSGLANYIPLEELEGKTVAVMCNLKPSKMRGVVSEAMVLAAGTDKVELLEVPEGSEVGEQIKIEGYDDPTPDELLKSKGQAKVWDRVVEKLATDQDKVACYDGKALTTSAGALTVPSLTKSPIK